MAQFWIVCVALWCLAGSVFCGAPSPCEQAAITVNNAANKLLAAYDKIKTPGLNISTTMETMCEAGNKAEMVAIEQAIPTCIALLSTDIQSNLSLIVLKGMPFTSFFTIFNSVQEACDCRMFLDHALMLRNKPPVKPVHNGYFPEIMDAGKVCSNKTTQDMPISIKDLTMYVNNKTVSSGTCPRLWSIAGFSTKIKFDAVVHFAQDRCATFDKDNFDCTVDASKTEAFKNCAKKGDSITSDDGKSCNRYECVMSEMKNCGSLSTKNFIAAVTTTNGKKISNDNCNAASSVQLSALAVLLTLLVSVIKK